MTALTTSQRQPLLLIDRLTPETWDWDDAVPATTETTGTHAYAATGAHVDLDARWQDHIKRVVEDGRLDVHTVLSLHLSPEAARDLLRQLQDAVYESDG